MSRAAAAITDFKLVKIPSPPLNRVFLSMPSVNSMKKHELVAALEALGEHPPPSWKVVDLRSRLLELEEEKGIHRVKGSRRPVCSNG